MTSIFEFQGFVQLILVSRFFELTFRIFRFDKGFCYWLPDIFECIFKKKNRISSVFRMRNILNFYNLILFPD